MGEKRSAKGALEAEGNELERRVASNQATADDFRSTFTVDKVCIDLLIPLQIAILLSRSSS